MLGKVEAMPLDRDMGTVASDPSVRARGVASTTARITHTSLCVRSSRRGRRTTDLTKGAATLPYLGRRAPSFPLSIFTNGRLVGAIPTCSHVRCVGLSGDGRPLCRVAVVCF